MKKKFIKLFSLVPPLKPTKRSLTSHTVFTTNQILKVLPDGHHWIIEPKRDGIRCQLHKDGGRIILLSDEEKKMSSQRLSFIIKEARAIFPPRCIIDGELLLAGSEGKSSQGHQAIAGYIHTHGAPSEKIVRQLRYFYWDLLLLGEKDLTSKPLTNRKELLKFKDTPHIKENPYVTVSEDLKKLRIAIKKNKSAEGAMVKAADSTYWQDSLIFKIKTFFDLDVIVKKVNRKIGGNTYDCTDREGNYIGTSYVQSYISAKPGDIVRVMVTKVFRHIDKKTGKETFRWYSPVVKRPEAAKDEGLKKEKIVKRHPKEADGQNVLREIWKQTSRR